MCGIAGIVNTDHEKKVLRGDVEGMIGTLAHRGPDDGGVYCEKNAGLGHRRLSILDLSAAGHQPMVSASGRYWITYNGEIYNFLSLRQELESKGHQFKSRTDTEVLLELFEREGAACLTRLRGMFAFAIWDLIEKRLFLARDPLGIKPLCYFSDSEKFVFGSEIKALLALDSIPREIDPEGLQNFFAHGHSTAPVTLFRGIRKLEPGHFMVVDGGKISIRRYWHPKPAFDDPKGPHSWNQLELELRDLLSESVESHLISDVPLGVFLSGGLDSSALVSLMAASGHRRIKTFTVGFDFGGRYNELDDARILARHFDTDHHELVLSIQDLKDSLPSLIRQFDEPFGDPAAFPTYFVSRLASESVKVCLSGEGGDELFGGYKRYLAERYGWIYRSLPAFLRDGLIPGTAARIPRVLKLKQLIRTISIVDPVRRQANWQMVFTDDLRAQLWNRGSLGELSDACVLESFLRHRDPGGSDGLNGVMFADCRSWLSDRYLEKVDKMSMAHSLEARVPILDVPVAEFAFRLPLDMKVKLDMRPGRRHMKRLFARSLSGTIPQSILTKPKHGFAVPIDPWFRGELSSFVGEILFDSRTRNRGYFNNGAVEKIFNEHQEGREVRKNHIWLLLLFELWHRAYIDQTAG